MISNRAMNVIAGCVLLAFPPSYAFAVDCPPLSSPQIAKLKDNLQGGGTTVLVFRHALTDHPNSRSLPRPLDCIEDRMLGVIGHGQAQEIHVGLGSIDQTRWVVLVSPTCRTIQTASDILGRDIDRTEIKSNLVGDYDWVYDQVQKFEEMSAEANTPNSRKRSLLLFTHSNVIEPLLKRHQYSVNFSEARGHAIALAYEGQPGNRTLSGCIRYNEWAP